MKPASARPGLGAAVATHAVHGWGGALQRWLLGWWVVLQFVAQMLVLALSPSSYHARQRPAVYRQLHAASAPLLAGFTALSALLSLVIIRIVIATAFSYGLSQYALDVLVRTLVIELLPLFVALYVALRYSMPAGAAVADMRQRGLLHAQWRGGGDPGRDVLLPRVLGAVFAVLLLASWSAVLALVMTYVSLYGFTLWGLAAYARGVGHVFAPAATLILCMKTFFFSVVVATLPLAPNPRRAGVPLRSRDEIGQLARVFALILLIEVVSLVGNYA